MNRRQKIIVSVIGIFIVLLALVGITYGYFLTRIQGNTNTTSVRVTTKDLELVYGDGTNEIVTKTNILPGDVIGTKDFTVTNNGGDTSYVVLIEDINVTYATDGTTRNNVSYSEGDTTTFISNDFVYTLTCTSNIEGNTCNEQSFETSLPMKDGIILGNNIKEGEIHTYNLTVTYKETGEDQTDDMNKKLSAKVNIEDIKRINPYRDNENSLAYNIINNSMLNKNGTELVATPPTKVAEEISMWKVRDIITIDKIETYGATSISYTDQTFVLKVLADASIINNCAEPTYEAANKEQCGGMKVGFTTCEEVQGKYIYNQDEGIAWYVENCIRGMNVSSGFAGMQPELLYDAYIDEKWTYDIDEAILSVTQDDLGTSFYYRGNVSDNYVDFAEMCWRIVRINGDGSVKLILEDQDNICKESNGNWDIPASNGEILTMNGDAPYITGNFGHDIEIYSRSKNIVSYLNPITNADRSMVNAFKYFQNNSLDGYTDKLKSGNWCYNDIVYDDEIGTNIIDKKDYYSGTISGSFYYDSHVRLIGDGNIEKNPTLKCNGTIMDEFNDNSNMYVGTVTADEIMYAGGKYNEKNINYYLLNTYQVDNNLYFWPLSPNYFNGSYDFAFSMNNEGYLSNSQVYSNFPSFRPAISLVSSAVITGGEGIRNNPYVIG